MTSLVSLLLICFFIVGAMASLPAQDLPAQDSNELAHPSWASPTGHDFSTPRNEDSPGRQSRSVRHIKEEKKGPWCPLPHVCF